MYVFRGKFDVRPCFGICVTSLGVMFMCDIQIDSRMGAVRHNCSSKAFNVYYANCLFVCLFVSLPLQRTVVVFSQPGSGL
jgi:hypothetical protein